MNFHVFNIKAQIGGYRRSSLERSHFEGKPKMGPLFTDKHCSENSGFDQRNREVKITFVAISRSRRRMESWRCRRGCSQRALKRRPWKIPKIMRWTRSQRSWRLFTRNLDRMKAGNVLYRAVKARARAYRPQTLKTSKCNIKKTTTRTRMSTQQNKDRDRDRLTL